MIKMKYSQEHYQQQSTSDLFCRIQKSTIFFSAFMTLITANLIKHVTRDTIALCQSGETYIVIKDTVARCYEYSVCHMVLLPGFL